MDPKGTVADLKLTLTKALGTKSRFVVRGEEATFSKNQLQVPAALFKDQLSSQGKPHRRVLYVCASMYAESFFT